MIAQLISQISSHFIVYYHRRIIQSAKQEYEGQRSVAITRARQPAEGTGADGGIVPLVESSIEGERETERLCQHGFSRQHRGASEKLTVRRYVNHTMLIGSLLVCALLVVSCDLASMKLEALGVVALLIELGQNLEQAVRYESVFTIVDLLVEQAKFLGGIRNYIGLGSLAFLFVLTVLLVPICLIMTLLYHWFAPLTAKRRKAVAVTLEILQAWQYIEVYILAIIIESW